MREMKNEKIEKERGGWGRKRKDSLNKSLGPCEELVKRKILFSLYNFFHLFFIFSPLFFSVCPEDIFPMFYKSSLPFIFHSMGCRFFELLRGEEEKFMTFFQCTFSFDIYVYIYTYSRYLPSVGFPFSLFVK